MKNWTKTVLFVSLFISFFSCKKDEEVTVKYDPTPYTVKYYNNTLPIQEFPQDNKLTVAKVQLGKMLFYETAMSKDNSISCSTCHNQGDGFSDSKTFSEGVGGALGKRQSMAVINLAWNNNQFFWDGRANLLRDQALLPIQDHLEMDETLENVVTKLSARVKYTSQFNRAFGSTVISSEKIALALEQFMLTLISENSKFDQYLAGKTDLTESELRGKNLFYAEYNPFFPDVTGADCAHCHAGNNFENDLYMNNGLDTDATFTDLGRENATENANDRAKFKVPTLRNIAVTGPYMHDGRFETLEEVIDHYNNEVKNSSTVDPAIQGTNQTGLMLDAQEKQDLINFLHTLTDNTFLNNPEFANPH